MEEIGKMDIQSIVVTDIDKLFIAYQPKGWCHEVKNRPSFGLSFCLDGQITYTQDGVDYVENRAHAVILPMGKSYSLNWDKSGHFPVINFYTLKPITDRIVTFEVKNPTELKNGFDEMQRLVDSGQDRLKLFSILYEMLSELSYTESAGVLDPALEFLRENFSLPEITNEALAEICNISEVYFHRLFKEYMNQSPKQYILSLRLKKAKQLLAVGDMKIWSIAETCGFESTAHFCRTFKAHFETTPKEYRKSHRIRGI